MKQIGFALLAGMLFGAGLVVSQMVNPEKVLGFLDVAGNWDPSLALVMVGALCVTTITFQVILPKRSKPIFDDRFRIPTRTDIDKPLLMGSAIFGIGWGMTGYCPGPVVASISFGFEGPIIMLISIIAGFIFHKKVIEVS